MENKNSLTTAAALDVALVDNMPVYHQSKDGLESFFLNLFEKEGFHTDNRSPKARAMKMMSKVLGIHQSVFNYLLNLLDGTSKENPRKAHITIGSEAAFGLSQLELPTVTGLCLSDSGKDVLIQMDYNWVDFWFFDLYDVLKIMEEA